MGVKRLMYETHYFPLCTSKLRISAAITNLPHIFSLLAEGQFYLPYIY